MRYRIPVADILEHVIAGMQYTATVRKIVKQVGEVWTINVSDIFYLIPGFTITINGGTFTVMDFKQLAHSWQLVVCGTGNIAVGNTFSPNKIYFFHGTPVDTTSELSQISSAFNKLPMIWMLENYTSDVYDAPFKETEQERDVDLKLYFLGYSDPQANLTSGILHKYINPMDRLLQLFIEQCHKHKELFYDQYNWKYRTETFTKFGVYITMKGVKTALLAENCAGVGLYITLKLRRPNTNCFVSNSNITTDDGEEIQTDAGENISKD